jgi:zinc transport system substrate-binding protein
MIAVMFAAIGLSACGKEEKANIAGGDSLSIVTTVFPEYDWVMNILGDNPANADVTLLLDNGVDLHSYNPTADDIIKISACDMFIYVGGESDGWVDDALKEAVNPDMVVINLLDVLGDSVKEEEVVEGMEAEEEEEEEGEEGEEEVEYDEHVWLSLRNASKLCTAIEEGLEKIDASNASVYKSNLSSYTDKLNVLDEKYEEAVSAGSKDTVLFADRFPFRYLVDDYGLNYYAAFVGCSAETEASFETVLFLANKVDELSLHTVLTIEGKDHKIADTVISSTLYKDQKTATMDSMQSCTSQDVKNGVTYVKIMEDNLEVLKEALR